MTETDNTIILSGRALGFTPPTEGQLQAMIRIGKAMQAGVDDEAGEFWRNQVHRIGKLIYAMVDEADHELLDDLYIEGKVDHMTVLTAVLKKINDSAEESENKAIAKAAARVKRK